MRLAPLGSRLAVADLAEGSQGAVTGIGQRAGVLLRGGYPPVPKSLLHDDDVGAAGEQPGRVRGSQVVEGDLLLDFCG
jgi:hypothetical protein